MNRSKTPEEEIRIVWPPGKQNPRENGTLQNGDREPRENGIFQNGDQTNVGNNENNETGREGLSRLRRTSVELLGMYGHGNPHGDDLDQHGQHWWEGSREKVPSYLDSPMRKVCMPPTRERGENIVPLAVEDQLSRLQDLTQSRSAKRPHAQESGGSARPVVPPLESLWTLEPRPTVPSRPEAEVNTTNRTRAAPQDGYPDLDISPLELRRQNEDFMYDIPRDATQYEAHFDPLRGLVRQQGRSFSPHGEEETRRGTRHPFMVNSRSTAEILLNQGGFSTVVERPHYVENNPTSPWARRMQSVEDRLATFTLWPKSDIVSPESLAEAGWYYTGPDDRVECAFCQGAVHNWVAGDTALGEHTRHFPDCSFVQEKIHRTFEPVGPWAPSPHHGRGPRDVNSGMSMESALQAVRELGFSTRVIQRAISYLVERGGEVSSENILNVIFELRLEGDEGEQGGEPLTKAQALSTPPSGSDGEPTSSESQALDRQQARGVSTGDNGVWFPGQLAANGVGDAQQMYQRELSKEYEELQNKVTCKICFDAKVAMLFLPCRHLVCCEECASLVRECPFCRGRIEGTVKVFM